MAMDPTSRGDLEAELVRRWYEKNRETWWARHRSNWDGNGSHADEFILGLMNEVGRIGLLSDTALGKEIGPSGAG